MIDPVRLTEQGGALMKTLLDSASLDQPAPGAFRRAMAGVATACAASVAAGASASTVAGAGTSGSAATGTAVLAKGIAVWAACGALGGAVVTTGAMTLPGLLESPPSSHDSPTESGMERARRAAPAAVPAEPQVAEPPRAEGSRGEPARDDAATSDQGRSRTPGALPARSVPAAPESGVAQSTTPFPGEPSPPEASRQRAGEPTARSAAAPSSAFGDELVLIDEARQSLARGDAERALGAVARYDAAFARGHFAPEALALRVEALVARGDQVQARVAAERFLAAYPSHPLASRVRRMTSSDGRSP
jgi:hypothetical protein